MTRTIDRTTIAARLRELADYLRGTQETHRARAYERAAERVEHAPTLEQLIEAGELKRLPGIGDSLAKTITDLAREGTTPLLERLRAQGPAPVRTIRVKPEPGLLLPAARELSDALVRGIRTAPAALAVAPAGAARRGVEKVDVLEVVVATEQPEEVLSHLTRNALVAHAAATTHDRIEALLVTGEPLLVHLTPMAALGTAIVRSTSTPQHLAALQALAHTKGVSLDAASEPAVYAAVGLPMVPAEARDDASALDDARAGRLDALVELDDIRGSIHCHTSYSDGTASIEEMARAALALGHEYVAITDHSGAAHYAGGLDEDRLRAQWDEIDAVEARLPIRILRGTEVDILADGALDWPDHILERLEVVIASIHQRHKHGEVETTRRLVRALSAPVFKIWGHPLGRLIGKRAPIECHLGSVFDALARAGGAIEINGDPHRLDLPPEIARRARDRGLPFVCSADAHSTAGLGSVQYAVDMARRARLTAADVLNTRTPAAFAATVSPARPLAA